MKLRDKIRGSLLIITICACLVTGMVSYKISEAVLVDKTQNMSINLVKQIGLNLDERIDAFADISYRILQTSSINKILYYDKASALINEKDSNDDFRTALLQQSSLYSYTKYALLRPYSNVITEYYKSRVPKLSDEEEHQILDYLEARVTVSRPVNWVVYEDQVYFVRRMIKEGGTDLGIMCFAMTDNFFEFVGTEQDYLSNNSIVLLGKDESLLKYDMTEVGEAQIEEIAGHNEGNYYVYTSVIQAEGERYVTVALNTRENDWCIIGFLAYEKLLGDLNSIFLLIICVMLAVIICAFVVAAIIARTISRNVAIIEQGMLSYEAGDFSVRLKPVSYDETGMLVTQMNYMGMKIGNLIEEVKDKEKAKQEAEYRTVQAQINPHFLYNTLGSIKWAAWRRKESETVTSIDALVNLLRFTIKRASTILPLREELDYIRNYIIIEKVRYADAFRMEYEIEPEVMEWMVPGFILQPFLENALIHGLDMSQEDPCIILRGYRQNDMLCLEIEDNGVGMSEEVLERIWEDDTKKTDTNHRGYNSIGIKIVNSRLQNFYGEVSKISIASRENKGTKVTLLIPHSEEKENEVQDFDSGR